MQQISSTTVLEESVKDVLVDYADDFVSALIDKACKMIKNREIKKIESRDIEFILKNIYNMPVVSSYTRELIFFHSQIFRSHVRRHTFLELKMKQLTYQKRNISQRKHTNSGSLC